MLETRGLHCGWHNLLDGGGLRVKPAMTAVAVAWVGGLYKLILEGGETCVCD